MHSFFLIALIIGNISLRSRKTYLPKRNAPLIVQKKFERPVFPEFNIEQLVNFPSSSNNNLLSFEERVVQLSPGRMTVNNRGIISGCNELFLSMLNLPSTLVQPGQHEELVLQSIMDRSVNPQEFLDDRERSITNSQEVGGILELEDGRSVSYSIIPEWHQGQVVSRIYQFTHI